MLNDWYKVGLVRLYLGAPEAAALAAQKIQITILHLQVFQIIMYYLILRWTSDDSYYIRETTYLWGLGGRLHEFPSSILFVLAASGAVPLNAVTLCRTLHIL